MAHILVADKLKRVLYKFSDDNNSVSGSDDIYLQKLSNLLANSESDGQVLARLPFCMEWLEHVVDKWKDVPPRMTVASFALRLAAVIVGDAGKFTSLQSAGALDSLLGFLEPAISSSGPVATAYVVLLMQLLEHGDGCLWIMESQVWRKVIKLSQDSRCIQVCRDSHMFIGKLVVKLQSKDSGEGCEEIVNHALEPLQRVGDLQDLEGEECVLVLETVSLMCSVFEAALSASGSTDTLLLLEKHQLESLMWKFMKMTDDESCIARISKILVLLYFALFTRMCSKKPVTLRNICFKSKIFDILTYLTTKGYIKNILYFCFQCKVYFHKFSIKDVRFEDKSKLYEIEDQLMCFQILPILCFHRRVIDCDDVFSWQYTQKLFDSASEETVRLAYPLREVLISDVEKIPEYSKCAINYILQLKYYLTKERVATICQALAYALMKFVVQQPDEYIDKYSDTLSAILDGLSALIDHFQLSWREIVESICLFSFVEHLLKSPLLSATVVVKALRLMQVAVRNYLPPNLALLVDTVGGSSIQELGPLLHRRLHDTSWDVRDSALELLHTVADISHDNFPAFQEHIMENDLCALTLSLAMDDAESYVRASALKCLGSMVKVPRYWDDCFSSRDLPLKLISILSKESEGIVRREAALLMKEIYQHQIVQKSMERDVFAAMVSAATRDLYWEVKVNALCFWEKVIDQQLSHQGMIDGRFPPITFSREHRKIVTLTEDEVKSRVNKALEELGRVGCLQVLLSAVQDYDLQVALKAVAIATSLSALLFQYGVLPVDHAADTSKHDTCKADKSILHNGESPPSPRKTVGPDSDQVIENILGECDVSLLSRVYRSQMNVSDASPNQTVTPVAAKDFLAALTTLDLQVLLQERTQWMDSRGESLNCLLDDILSTHADPENIVTDCY